MKTQNGFVMLESAKDVKEWLAKNNQMTETKEIEYKPLDISKRDMDNRLFVLLLEKYKINPFSNLSVKDVAKDLGMNQNSANLLFKREDFPSINITKPKQICALSYYLMRK